MALRGKKCLICHKGGGPGPLIFVDSLGTWLHEHCVEAAHRQIARDELEARRAHQERNRAVKCPRCGAEPGARCTGSRGQPRTSNHAVRRAGSGLNDRVQALGSSFPKPAHAPGHE